MAGSCRALGAKETLRQGICRAAVDQAEQALALLASPEVDSEALVHDLRVTTKRLRALWQWVRPFVDRSLREQANRELRETARLLAEDRTTSVFRPLIRELEDGPPESAEAGPSGINARIARELSKVFEKEIERWRGLEKELAVEASDRLLVKRGWGGTLRRAQKWRRRAVERGDFATFHTLRKWTKYLRYQLEVLAPRGDAKFQELHAALERLGHLLGLLNDLNELDGAAPADSLTAMRLSSAGRSQLRRRLVSLRAECEQLSNEIYVRDRDKLIRIVSSSLDSS